MDITEQQRASLASQVRTERVRQFGAKSAAYQAAELNAATWDRIEAGERVRDDRLIAAVKLLWPASGGDWQAIDSAPATDQRDVREWLAELDARVEALEQREDEEHARSAPSRQAAGSAAPGKRVHVNGDVGDVKEVRPRAPEPHLEDRPARQRGRRG